jgi:hypothetical protein
MFVLRAVARVVGDSWGYYANRKADNIATGVVRPSSRSVCSSALRDFVWWSKHRPLVALKQGNPAPYIDISLRKLL